MATLLRGRARIRHARGEREGDEDESRQEQRTWKDVKHKPAIEQSE